MSSRSITIATPFYNEEESLENYFNVLKKINSIIGKKLKAKYLFIDDGSTDQTKEKLIEFEKKNPEFNIQLHFHEKNFGYGRTLKNSIELSNTDYS